MMQRGYEVECGDIKGAVVAKTPAAAFRKIIAGLNRRGESTHPGELARFREVIAFPKTGLARPDGPWFYQEPNALLAPALTRQPEGG